MLSGILLCVLALAAPTILGVVGFSAVGPVAGSTAAAWQASIGLVATGSAFSFFQSAAMGGAAMGVIGGIGASGVTVAVAVGLASLKGRGLMNNADGAIDGLIENAKGAIGGFMGNVKGFFGRKKED